MRPTLPRTPGASPRPGVSGTRRSSGVPSLLGIGEPGEGRDTCPVMSARSSTVDDVLRRSARRHPNRTALRFADRVWSYRELDDAVSRAVGVLLGLGLARGDRVAAYGRNSDAYLIAFLACARAGLVHVPINYALRGGELAYLVE